MGESARQGCFEFDEVHGYLERKEGFIFSLLREECPNVKISFRLTKEGQKRQFKVRHDNGHVYQLNFTDAFLFSRTLEDLKCELLFNLEYMKKANCSSRASFCRGGTRIKDF
ncbi:MAG: hypothetical protein PQJ59_14440 [Spirochaetales bacterium]|nr:hypothetical protein [Spirochaetales bacterium]